jgi:hypothetical protein
MTVQSRFVAPFDRLRVTKPIDRRIGVALRQAQGDKGRGTTDDTDACALLRETLRDGETDAARSSGDEGVFPRDAHEAASFALATRRSSCSFPERYCTGQGASS